MNDRDPWHYKLPWSFAILCALALMLLYGYKGFYYAGLGLTAIAGATSAIYARKVLPPRPIVLREGEQLEAQGSKPVRSKSMNRKSVAVFALGLACYAVCEIVPLTSAIGVWQIYGTPTPDKFTGVPFGSFSWMVQFDKPLFMLFAVPALLFFFWSFSYLKMARINQVMLYSFTTLAVVFAIPDWLWEPSGSAYYEILKYYGGLGSLFVAFIAITLYIQAWVLPERMKVPKEEKGTY
jgi:hypothetical protein